jgi:predicted AAA+ superfamily ATPase
MIQHISQWNRWGSAKLSSGIPREVTPTIRPYLDTPEVIALVGLRRSGKSTVMYQLMDALESQKIPQEAILHVNFEEPALATQLSLELLDDIYRSFREEIYPSGKAYVFFDEIQIVPSWEKWVRARNETEDIKIFITGSSANLMSRELGTVLTGRHIEFFITPLNFSEFLTFNKIEKPTKSIKTNPDAKLQHALNQYMRWGGMPEVVLSDTQDRKERLLKQYFEDILFKDIAMRHQVRDITILRNIAVHLLTQTACLCSTVRIAKIFGISKDMAAKYCNYIAESFMLDFVPYFSLKSSERQRHPQKVHTADLGFRQIAGVSTSPDHSKLTETLVYQQLQRKFYGNIFYWKGQQEVDFVIREGNDITSIIQAAYKAEDTNTLHRELSSLDEAQARFTNAKARLILAYLPKGSDVRITPLWHFLLET